MSDVDYSKMTIADVEDKIDELNKLLSEVEEQTLFALRSTGHHLSGSRRKKLESEVKKVKSEIRELSELLQKMRRQTDSSVLRYR